MEAVVMVTSRHRAGSAFALGVASLLAGLCVVDSTLGAATATPAAAPAAGFQVSPPTIKLIGNFERAQLVVIGADGQGKFSERSPDLTQSAVYKSNNPPVVTV